MSNEATEAEAVAEQPAPETFLKTIMVDVTNDEHAQRKDRLVAVDRKIIETQAEKATANSDFNDEIKQLTKERLQLLAAIACQREGREVACYLERDDRLGKMITKRADNNEVVDERALTVDERQTELFGQAPPDGSEPAGAATANDAAAAEDNDSDEKPEPKASNGAGKVTRIRASDVKKKKAAREAKEAADKARALADQNDRDNEGGESA